MCIQLFVDGPVLLSDPSVNVHVASASIDFQFKYSSASHHELWPIRAVACFPSIRQVNIIVRSPEVSAVVTSC